MWRTILVDDEDYVRAELSSVFPWNEYGFSLVDEAKNGQEAIKLVQQLYPDVILTDILMPDMDGLALTAWVREHAPTTAVVVVSAYTDFPLVREILRLGAIDYLTKAEITTDVAGGFLERLNNFLIEQRNTYIQGVDGQYYHHLVLTLFWRDLLNGILKPIQAETRAQSMGIDVKAPYGLILIHEDRFEEYMRSTVAPTWLDGLASSVAGNLPDSRWWLVDCQQGDWALIITRPEGLTQDLSPMAIRIADLGGGKLTVSSFPGWFDFTHLIHAYKEAKEANALRLYGYGGRYINYEELIALKRAELPGLSQLLGDWERVLRSLDMGKIHGFLEGLFTQTMPATLPPIQAKWLMLGLAGILGRVAMERHLCWGELYSGDDLISLIERAESCRGWQDWLRQRADVLVSHASKEGESHTTHIIKKALAFIQVSFARDISLQEVAAYVGVNKCYLSRIFPAHVGECFNAYIQRLRIERAKELLRLTNDHIHDIARTVGFWNVRYFSRVFREIVGVTPAEYRRLPLNGR